MHSKNDNVIFHMLQSTSHLSWAWHCTVRGAKLQLDGDRNTTEDSGGRTLSVAGIVWSLQSSVCRRGWPDSKLGFFSLCLEESRRDDKQNETTAAQLHAAADVLRTGQWLSRVSPSNGIEGHRAGYAGKRSMYSSSSNSLPVRFSADRRSNAFAEAFNASYCTGNCTWMM